MPTWVCLLRAINLGSHNKVNMPALREALTSSGFGEVRTYMQSGNVVLASPLRSETKVAASVREVVAERMGVDTPVVVRSPAQVRDLLAWNPFPEQAASRPQHVYALMLVDEPAPEAVAPLVGTDWGDDAVAARGRDVVVRYGVQMHDSRLQHATILKRLGTDGTARNWRTVSAIADLL